MTLGLETHPSPQFQLHLPAPTVPPPPHFLPGESRDRPPLSQAESPALLRGGHVELEVGDIIRVFPINGPPDLLGGVLQEPEGDLAVEKELLAWQGREQKGCPW